MQQMFPQIESSNKSTIMKDVGLSIILVIVTLLGSIIAAIVLGTIHVVDFTWPLFIMGGIMLAITAFFAWYSIERGRSSRSNITRILLILKAMSWRLKMILGK